MECQLFTNERKLHIPITTELVLRRVYNMVKTSSKDRLNNDCQHFH